MRARQRVVEAHPPIVSSALLTDRTPARAIASSRASTERTAESSGPVDAPVSASRSERRSPPTALSSRRMARESSDESGPAPTLATRRTEERRSSVGRKLDRLRLEDHARIPAGLDQRARAAEHGHRLRGASAAAASSSSDISAIASIASRRSRARSRWTSCSGRSSSSRYARTARAGNPSSRSSAMEECPCRFESFFPSGPSTRPWCSTSGSSPPIARAIRCWSSRLGRWSFPRMTWVIPSSRSSATEAS